MGKGWKVHDRVQCYLALQVRGLGARITGKKGIEGGPSGINVRARRRGNRGDIIEGKVGTVGGVGLEIVKSRL